LRREHLGRHYQIGEAGTPAMTGRNHGKEFYDRSKEGRSRTKAEKYEGPRKDRKSTIPLQQKSDGKQDEYGRGGGPPREVKLFCDSPQSCEGVLPCRSNGGVKRKTRKKPNVCSTKIFVRGEEKKTGGTCIWGGVLPKKRGDGSLKRTIAWKAMPTRELCLRTAETGNL